MPARVMHLHSHHHLHSQPAPHVHAALRLWVCMLLLGPLLGIQNGCEAGCTRVVSLEAQNAAESYLQHSRARRADIENAKVPPYAGAIVKFRGMYGSGKPIDWRLLSPRERQLALVGLLIGERNKHEDNMLAALIAGGGVDPFAADPFGAVPFALAFDGDRFAAKLLVTQLRTHARSRPTDAVLCGLRANELAGTLSTLRAYCPCERADAAHEHSARADVAGVSADQHIAGSARRDPDAG